MKQYLKNFKLTETFIENAICLCLDPNKRRKNRWKRRDTSHLIAEYLKKNGDFCKSEKELANELYELAQVDYLEVRKYAPMLAENLLKEIKNRSIELQPIRNTIRIDGHCGKKRIIGIASMKQQVLDWVISEALDNFFNDKIHDCQESGISHRGPLHASKRISRWIEKRPKDMKYCVQGDVHKFYQSVDHDILKGIFRKYIVNEDILYLADLMIDSYGQRGISIGSYLSLRMGNLIMGIALHWLEENSFYTDRKGKRKRRFSHVIVYTDNVSIFGSNRTQVKRAMQDIAEYLCINFKLTVTSPWIFRSLEKDGFYDVAGYKIYASHTTIRKRSFKRTRNECIRNKRDYDPLTARSVASRWGQLKWTDSFNFCTKYKYFRAFSQSKKVIQNEAKSRIL